jgi:hypothetical protein
MLILPRQGVVNFSMVIEMIKGGSNEGSDSGRRVGNTALSIDEGDE